MPASVTVLEAGFASVPEAAATAALTETQGVGGPAVVEASEGSGFVDAGREGAGRSTGYEDVAAFTGPAAKPRASARRKTPADPTLTAKVARDAGREAALKATEEEISALTDKHRVLARKKVTGTISPSESLELQLVRWELDRIEDARTGPARDVLWAALEPRRELARDITQLVEQLRSAGIGRGRDRGRRR
jgi:hypothetical protein